jgi:hypothetical protein
MKKLRVRHLAKSALALAILLGAVSRVAAVVLAPGDCMGLGGTTAAAQPELAGVVLQDNLIPFTIADAAGNPCFQGVVQDRVVQSDLTGELHFYFYIRDTVPNLPCCLVKVARTGFADAPTDVDYRVDGLGTVGPSVACRTPTGDEVDFYFDPCIPSGLDSYFVFVITSAQNFDQVGTLTLTTDDGSTINITVAGPL